MDYCLQKRKAKDSKKINVTGLTDFELRPIEDQDINYDEAVNMFNSSRSMVTNQRNSSMSMLDKTNFGIGGAGAKGIPSSAESKEGANGLLSTKPRDSENVFLNTAVGMNNTIDRTNVNFGVIRDTPDKMLKVPNDGTLSNQGT
jgi:hypothetical protein